MDKHDAMGGSILLLEPIKTTTDYRFLRINELMQHTGLLQSNTYARIAEGDFPKQIHLGIRSVAWLDKDIQNWM